MTIETSISLPCYLPPLTDSKIPDTQSYVTDARLSSYRFMKDDTIKTDMLWGSIIKKYMVVLISQLICHSATVKPPSNIFKKWVNCSMFSTYWNKTNICQFINDKQTNDNYRFVSSSLEFGKIFEKLFFQFLFRSFSCTNDEVWHDRLFYKLKSVRISGSASTFVESSLANKELYLMGSHKTSY